MLSHRCEPATTLRPRSRRGERGTVLLLFPAAVMVVLVLTAVTLDLGLLRVRIQQLRAVAASAANDVVGAADVDALRSTGEISFDPVAARVLVQRAVKAGSLPDAVIESVTITPGHGGWEIAVTLSLEVNPMIAPALPGSGGAWRPTVTEHVLALH